MTSRDDGGADPAAGAVESDSEGRTSGDNKGPAEYDEDRDVTLLHQQAPAADPGQLPPEERTAEPGPDS